MKIYRNPFDFKIGMKLCQKKDEPKYELTSTQLHYFLFIYDSLNVFS